MTTIEAIPAFRDNYIWVAGNKQYAAAIDPGDAAPLLDYLESKGLALVAILNTHHHGDHVGGNLELKKKFSCPIYGPAAEIIPGMTHPVSGGDTVFLPEIEMACEVMDIPGHTSGHIAFLSKDRLFCGDTLFGCGCGRVFEGTMKEMQHSLEKLASLPEETLVYCAHEYTLANIAFAREVEPCNDMLRERGEKALEIRKRGMPTIPSTIGLEKMTNPFLRCGIEEVAESASRHEGRPLRDRLDVFSALRIWKNSF